MSTPDTYTRITILKHLVAGRSVHFTSAATRVPTNVVEHFATEAGWPDVSRVRRIIDALTTQATPRISTDPQSPSGAPLTTRTPATTPAPVQVQRVDVTRELLDHATNSTNRRTVALGNRIRADLTRLRDKLAKEHAAAKEREAAARDRLAREQARAAERAARAVPTLPVEQRLTALGVTTWQIKRWAVDQGLITAVRRGRVAAHLVDAYEQAHPTTNKE